MPENLTADCADNADGTKIRIFFAEPVQRFEAESGAPRTMRTRLTLAAFAEDLDLVGGLLQLV
jgi:hypothetical protein